MIIYIYIYILYIKKIYKSINTIIITKSLLLTLQSKTVKIAFLVQGKKFVIV